MTTAARATWSSKATVQQARTTCLAQRRASSKSLVICPTAQLRGLSASDRPSPVRGAALRTLVGRLAAPARSGWPEPEHHHEVRVRGLAGLRLDPTPTWMRPDREGFAPERPRPFRGVGDLRYLLAEIGEFTGRCGGGPTSPHSRTSYSVRRPMLVGTPKRWTGPRTPWGRVAQPDRASAFEAEGYRFEPCRGRQLTRSPRWWGASSARRLALVENALGLLDVGAIGLKLAIRFVQHAVHVLDDALNLALVLSASTLCARSRSRFGSLAIIAQER